MMLEARLGLLVALVGVGCANQTTFHTVPQGARVYVNGALCGDSPCVYHTRYGFPDRIHLELKKDGYETADFYLDSEPPQISYLLLGFGSYLFHTFSEEYRFQLKPLPAVIAPTPPADSPTPSPSPAPTQPAAPKPREDDPSPSPGPVPEPAKAPPSLWI